MQSVIHLFLLAHLLISIFLQTLHAQFNTSQLFSPSSWTNNLSLNNNTNTFLTEYFRQFQSQRAFLLRNTGTSFQSLSYSSILQEQQYGNYSLSFACGFYAGDPTENVFDLGVFLTITDEEGHLNEGGAELVWSGNRGHLIRENAKLDFNKDGDLVLYDFDGTLVWNANTSGRSVVGISLSDLGNLVLFDSKNKTIWESFDHQTDKLILGQTLKEGRRLTANITATSSAPGLYYLIMVDGALEAYYSHDFPVMYYSSERTDQSLIGDISRNKWAPFNLSLGKTPQFIRLECNGHLRLYQLNLNYSTHDLWNSTDLLPLNYYYPLSCGEYGISSKGQCTCPDLKNETVFFRLINDQEPNLGCTTAIPISCKNMHEHKMMALGMVYYFDFSSSSYAADEESCKDGCLRKCSCKAAFYYERYYYEGNESLTNGSCYTTSKVLSINMWNSDSSIYIQVSAYLKVQIASGGGGVSNKLVLGLFFGSLILFIIMGFVIHYAMKKKIQEEDDVMPHLPGMPTRFSLAELKLATQNFTKMLGGGGFGSVFEGKNGDQKVAVKRLDGIGQGTEEFLAEVQTIGSIHHINLVRLIGYCAEKLERLLVYEYMSNGSLDKWILIKVKIRVLVGVQD